MTNPTEDGMTEPVMSTVMSPVRSSKSRYYRDPAARVITITDRDVDLFCDLLLLRFVTTPATYLLWVREEGHANVRRTSGAYNWPHRLRDLFDNRYLSRFVLSRSAYMPGRDFPVYCLEEGVATAVAEAKRQRHTITDAEWDGFMKATSPQRERLVSMLATRGFDTDRIRKILEKNTEVALKVVMNEGSQVLHLALAGTFMALLVAAARAKGITPDAWLPDSMADISFMKGKTEVPLKPDALIVLDGAAIAVEAETGFSSRAKVAEKVARYGSLMAERGLAVVAEATGLSVVKSLRVVFHCQTKKHADMVCEEIRKAFPNGTGLFLVSTADDLHLNYSYAELVAGKTADIPDLYGCLRSLVTTPLFAQVEGTETVTVDRTKFSKPKVGYVALL